MSAYSDHRAAFMMIANHFVFGSKRPAESQATITIFKKMRATALARLQLETEFRRASERDDEDSVGNQH